MSNIQVDAFVDSHYYDAIHLQAIRDELARLIARQLVADGLITFDRPRVLDVNGWRRYRAHLLVAEKAK